MSRLLRSKARKPPLNYPLQRKAPSPKSLRRKGTRRQLEKSSGTSRKTASQKPSPAQSNLSHRSKKRRSSLPLEWCPQLNALSPKRACLLNKSDPPAQVAACSKKTCSEKPVPIHPRSLLRPKRQQKNPKCRGRLQMNVFVQNAKKRSCRWLGCAEL